MRRREFIMLLSCAAAIWPLAARAQQPERVRRVGVLVGLAENDPEMKDASRDSVRDLRSLGWVEGSNLRIDYRFAPAGAQARLLARELIALQPDVILTQSTPATAAMQQETRTIPSSSLASPTRSVSGFVRACRGQAAISPACCNTRRASPANGWRCSRKSHRILRALPLSPTQEQRRLDYFLQSAKAVAPSLRDRPVAHASR